MVPEFENSNFFSVVSFSETPVCLEVKEIFAAVKESPEKNLRLQWEALKASDFFFFFFLGFLRRSLSLVSLSAVHIRLISLICASLYCMLCCTCIISYVRLFAFFWLDAVFSSSSSSSCNSPPQFLQTTFVHEHKLL